MHKLKYISRQIRKARRKLMMRGVELCLICQDSIDQYVGRPLPNEKDLLACLDYFRDKKQEYFVCLSFDGNGRLLARRVVTIGLLSVTLVHPREVFVGPISDRAAYIIVAHNHTSGIATPSVEDRKTNQLLVAVGVIINIPVKDHIIVAKNDHFSFQKHKLI